MGAFRLLVMAALVVVVVVVAAGFLAVLWPVLLIEASQDMGREDWGT